MNLSLPVDFERLPEFRTLVVELAAIANTKSPIANNKPEAAACFIWMRLWVELAYLAQTTNQPGLLTPQGAGLFSQTLEPMLGEDIAITDLLIKAGCLKLLDKDQGWLCERFARLNPHLSGDFVSRERKGAAASAVERQANRIAHEAMAQAMLLPAETFKKPSGETMTQTEIQRSMVIIKTLDNYLSPRGRKKHEYTEGLMLDALAVAEKYSTPALKEWYAWLDVNREHPAVPKTTEQMLSKFDEVMAMKG